MKKQFKGKQYDYRIIIEALGLYYHFSLSDRDCAKLMEKFSIGVHHTTIYRWDKQYGKKEIKADCCLNPGGLMKRMSRLKGKTAIFTVPLIPMAKPSIYCDG